METAAGVVNGGCISTSSSCDFQTNWRVAAGSLKRTVLFESSSENCPVDASSLGSVNGAAIPLLLKPQAADSGPCEIKIRFLQKYEIRQIYVRSTARLYEVYYSQSWQSECEYLCTVRCGIAERDEQVLQAFDFKGSPENTKNSSVKLEDDKLTAEGNIASSEDDWVEVKVFDSSLEYRNDSLLNKNSGSIGRDIQDFYEATAEISDSDPCSSITLRFLSLQNKNCVFIDEVYVFADLVGEIDLEHQSQDVRSSSGSSLMAMLVPTLLQLSKSGMVQIQGQQASFLRKDNKIETQSKATDLTHLTCHKDGKGNGDQQNVELQTVVESTTEPAETQEFIQILDGDKSNGPLVNKGSPYGHIERVLEQLVSRVGKIEEVCLRFEENMLKPLNSMEMRIQRVEQQMEELISNSQQSGLPSCSKISGLFSCNSNSRLLHNAGCDHQLFGVSELEKKESASGDLVSTCDVQHCSPSLVVTAPDFSCEDDLDDHGSKSLETSHWETKKKPLIDDVLDASLSGLLSASTANIFEHKRAPFFSHNTSETICTEVSPEDVDALGSGVEITTNINAKEEASRYIQVLTVMAPEFISEEDTGEELPNYAEFDSIASHKIGEDSNDASSTATGNDHNAVTSDFCDINGGMLVSKQASSPCTVPSAVLTEANSKTADDLPWEIANTENDASESSKMSLDDEGDERSRYSCCFIATGRDSICHEAEGTARTDACDTVRKYDERECVTCLLWRKDDDFEQFSGHGVNDNDATAVGTAVSGTQCVAVKGPEKEILEDLGSSANAALVNFGIPILVVEFTPCQDSRTQLPLEALLDDVMDLNVEADPPQENGIDYAYTQESNFIDIDKEDGTEESLTSQPLLPDLGAYDVTPSSTGENVLYDSYSTGKQNSVQSLI